MTIMFAFSDLSLNKLLIYQKNKNLTDISMKKIIVAVALLLIHILMKIHFLLSTLLFPGINSLPSERLL